MSSEYELPAKCGECAKSDSSGFHRKCGLCKDLEFEESVLCDLNRAVQDITGFECHAFEPMLRVIGHEEKRVAGGDAPFKRPQKGAFSGLLDSDKIKYQRALALQQLKRDPDGIFVQLKYHILWNVTQRIPVFNTAGNHVDVLYDIFFKSSETALAFVHLLQLAPDHVHVFVESDGEHSIDEIIKRIKRFTGNAIKEEFPSINDRFEREQGIWDEAYFVETLG